RRSKKLCRSGRPARGHDAARRRAGQLHAPESLGHRASRQNRLRGSKMKRRDLIAGLALAAGIVEGQEQQPGAETLYIPKAHLVEDRALPHNLMDTFASVDLVTAAPTLRITHIPTFLDRNAGAYGTIYGHISRNNPQRETFDGRQLATIVFHGPHS